jgi:hypothetical protein
MACNEGLSLALDLNLLNIQVASDSLEAIHNLNRDTPYRYATILKRE